MRPRCCSHQQARDGQVRTARGSHPRRPAKLCTPNTASGQLRHPRRGFGQAAQRSASEGALRSNPRPRTKSHTCCKPLLQPHPAGVAACSGPLGSREGGSRTLRLRQPGRCGPSWSGRRCRTCTLSGRCCSFPQRSTFFNKRAQLQGADDPCSTMRPHATVARTGPLRARPPLRLARHGGLVFSTFQGCLCTACASNLKETHNPHL